MLSFLDGSGSQLIFEDFFKPEFEELFEKFIKFVKFAFGVSSILLTGGFAPAGTPLVSYLYLPQFSSLKELFALELVEFAPSVFFNFF